MRIDAKANYLFANQHALTNNAVTDRTGAAISFSTAQTTANADTRTAGGAGLDRPDFTSMTRRQMRDWVNDQVKSGKMSLDESAPFAAMTMKIRVSDNQIVPASADDESINFMEKTRGGIEGAFSRGDQYGGKQLQAALDFMLKHRGQTAGIDIHA